MILALFLLVVPVLAGSIFARTDRGSGSLLFRWVSGQFLLWMGFQLICVPLILRERSFGNVSALFLGYTAALALLASAAEIRRLARGASLPAWSLGRFFRGRQPVEAATPQGGLSLPASGYHKVFHCIYGIIPENYSQFHKQHKQGQLPPFLGKKPSPQKPEHGVGHGYQHKGQYLLLGAAAVSACLCSTLGALIVCMGVGIVGILGAVSYKRPGVLAPMASSAMRKTSSANRGLKYKSRTTTGM